ncbi:MAG: ParB N-terminal domain-containing protein [Anaerolineales bacterium]|nr:ParB N-terminal domain-containing protein [Anaerolineales bacterium]
MSEIKSIPVSDLIIPPGTKVRAGLLKSVKARGVLEPILVSPHSGGGYIVREGRRRVKAAIEAGLETVQAVVLEDGGPEITILTHATRSENPVAELDAIQELQRSGMSEKEIAAAGFAPVSRIRRLAKLNRLVPELAEKVDAGGIAANLAFEIANLPPQIQRGLLDEEKITAETVRQAKYARRQAAIPDMADLVGEAQRQRMATFENVIGQFSADTLKAVLADLPDEARFATWRAKFKRALGELEFAQSIKVHQALEVS